MFTVIFLFPWNAYIKLCHCYTSPTPHIGKRKREDILNSIPGGLHLLKFVLLFPLLCFHLLIGNLNSTGGTRLDLFIAQNVFQKCSLPC